MKILVTGTAGFIGFHLAKALLKRGDEVIGLDNINNYYDVNLKYGRLAKTGIIKQEIEYNKLYKSEKYLNYKFIKLNLEDQENIARLFKEQKFDKVCHLAAQAGVRYSLTNPNSYIQSNIAGFMSILEACRHNNIKHLVYASSSSVYGMNKKMPFSTHDNVDHPISLYAATKKSSELMAHTYSHLYGFPCTGLRFFTVYGPWGRPDMAMFLFTKAILEGKPIDVFNRGDMKRSFTYIDDIIQCVVKVVDNPPKADKNWDEKKPDPSSSKSPYKIYNIGSSKSVNLIDFIEAIERTLNKKAEKNLLPMQKGDVKATRADCSGLEKDFGYKPVFPVNEGVKRFVEWYKRFYKVDG